VSKRFNLGLEVSFEFARAICSAALLTLATHVTLLLHCCGYVLQLKADSDDLSQMFNNGRCWGCPFGKSLRYGAVLGLVDVSMACKQTLT
jgi:hypothetical protein